MMKRIRIVIFRFEAILVYITKQFYLVDNHFHMCETRYGKVSLVVIKIHRASNGNNIE